MEIETWTSILGFEGCYEVSDIGNIRSVDRITETILGYKRKLKGVPLRKFISKRGYEIVSLFRNRKNKTYYVHRLVYQGFNKKWCPNWRGVIK